MLPTRSPEVNSHCSDAHYALLCHFLQSAFCGTCGLAIPRGFCHQRHDRSSGLPGEEYPGGVVGNTCSYASVSHLPGLCWSSHPRMDEPRIPPRPFAGSQIPGPVCVWNRRGRTMARQRDRTCSPTTLCAIRSPAYRSCSVCCVSDLVGLARFDGQVSECWELLTAFCPESQQSGS